MSLFEGIFEFFSILERLLGGVDVVLFGDFS